MQRFELRVLPGAPGARFDLEVHEVAYKGRDLAGNAPTQLAARLSGTSAAFPEVLEPVRAWLRERGHRPSSLEGGKERLLDLDEEAGVRLALLFGAVGPVRKVNRIEAIVRGIAAMSREEALYWYGKAREDVRDRALQALRILLAGEQRARGDDE